MKTFALALSFCIPLLAVPSSFAQEVAPNSMDQPTQSKILYDVMSELVAEPALQGDDTCIEPDIDQDHFVTLEGVVPDQATRAYAEDRVSHVPGVRWVFNKLVVGQISIVPGPAQDRSPRFQ